MKIAYLTGEYPRATDTFIQREVAGLRQLGLNVVTCSIRRTDVEHLVGTEQREEATKTFHVLESAARPMSALRAQLRALAKPARYFSALGLAWRTAPKGIRGRLFNLIYFAEAAVLAAHMQDQRVTHLHNHIAKSSCSVAMIASTLSGIPYSFTLHGPDIFFAPDHWRLDAKIARARFVACISEFCRAQAMFFSATEDWDKLKIIHCGVDPGRYQPAERSGNRLLFVGRLAAVKGLPVLFDAFAKSRADNPNLSLTVVGDGPDRAALVARAKMLGNSDAINFTGYRSQSEVAALLANHDALVLPSFAEGVPVVLMEAMAANLPVIATQVGGVGELVSHGVSGLHIPPGDPDALANAITSLMANPDMREQMGAAGRKVVEAAFDANLEAARLAKLFRSGHALPSEKRPEVTQ